jgi:hypothetical protein
MRQGFASVTPLMLALVVLHLSAFAKNPVFAMPRCISKQPKNRSDSKPLIELKSDPAAPPHGNETEQEEPPGAMEQPVVIQRLRMPAIRTWPIKIQVASGITGPLVNA